MDGPIGIFDSGVGGTTIWREIVKLLPWEDTRYLADTANAPYGVRTPEDILRLSVKNTELLLAMGAKIIVVACNTATTNAIGHLRARYPVPFVGIEPAIKPAALKSRTKVVGVLATRGTLSSELFHNSAKLHAQGIRVLEREGTGLVERIEAGELPSQGTKELLKGFLGPMLDQGMDCLVLGCTHYPYLLPLLRELLPVGFPIIDSGEAVARQTKAVLEANRALRGRAVPVHDFHGNGGLSVLKGLVEGPGVRVSRLDF